MARTIEFSPELVRLAQTRTRHLCSSLADELSRMALEESIVDLWDAEREMIIENEKALSSLDSLSSSLHVNDLVVNGLHLEVRALRADSTFSIPTAIIGTDLLASGIFLIEISGLTNARVVAYIDPAMLRNAIMNCRYESDAAILNLPYRTEGVFADFDIESVLSSIFSKIEFDSSTKLDCPLPDDHELSLLMRRKEKLRPARLKEIINLLVSSSRSGSGSEILSRMRELESTMPQIAVEKILRAGSRWNRTTEEMVNILSSTPDLKDLKPAQLKSAVLLAGEKAGGQSQAPLFQEAMISAILESKLSGAMDGKFLSRAKEMVCHLLEGVDPVEAVKKLLPNHTAVDLAVAIRAQRQSLDDFAAATAEEIGKAFVGLALKPTYATHSSKDSGVDTINEALQLLAAGRMAEEAIRAVNNKDRRNQLQ